ncbi:MAG: hypothetical protein ACLT1W_15460 [Alistipes onderdonkii]
METMKTLRRDAVLPVDGGLRKLRGGPRSVWRRLARSRCLHSAGGQRQYLRLQRPLGGRVRLRRKIIRRYGGSSVGRDGRLTVRIVGDMAEGRAQIAALMDGDFDVLPCRFSYRAPLPRWTASTVSCSKRRKTIRCGAMWSPHDDALR